MNRILPAALRRHVTPSLVISVIALIVALGGTAWAITITGGSIANGTITSADLRDNSVRGSDLRSGTVTSTDLGRGAVESSDLAAGSVTKSKLAAGVYSKGAGVTKAGSVSIDDGAGAATALDLASVNDEGDKQLTVTTQANILAVAHTTIFPDAAVAGQAACRLYINDGTAPTSGTTAMGQEQYFNFPGAMFYNNGYSVTGFATVAPGVYNVQLRCTNEGLAPSMSAGLSGLIAWTTPV